MKSLRSRNWKIMISVLMIAVLAAVVPHGCDLVRGNAPLNLYGIVIDQTGNPAPGAVVSFEAMARNRLQSPVLFSESGETTWRIQVTSGPGGRFDLHDGWGRALFLKSIEGPHYTQACLYLTFCYGRNPPEPAYRPDPAHPAVFLCWNDVFKRIVSREITNRVGNDLYTLSYRSGRVSPFGIGDENLHFRIVRPEGNRQRPYDWSLELSSVFPRTVEVADSDGPLQLQAPAGGYKHELVFTMRAADPNWSSQMTKRFYTCSGDGGVYAGVEMKVQLDANGADPTVTTRYTANFGGSRDLVPGPVAPAKK